MIKNISLAIILVLLSLTSLAEEFQKDGKHLFILSGQSNMRNPLPKTFNEIVAKVFGKDKVIVVTVAKPSQPIKSWYKKWTPPEGTVLENKGKGKTATSRKFIYRIRI